MSTTHELRYGYLGPAGTFAESALLNWLGSSKAELVAFGSVIAALDGVRQGDVAGAMVPLENSVEGSVSATLDALATSHSLMIAAEAEVPVTFSLLVREGTTLNEVTHVTTHPHAEAQCRGWLAERLPNVTFTASASTAAAAAAVAEPDSPFDAAISAPLASRVYGLVELETDLGVGPAVTRFVLVGPAVAPAAATGGDKTSLVLYIGEDHPGALLEILTEFAVRGVNLTRIESRPTGGGIGDYFFSVDIEGHIDDARVGEALTGLRRVCAEVRYLGSYPRIDRVRPQVRRGVSDEEFRDAQAWLARIREGRG